MSQPPQVSKEPPPAKAGVESLGRHKADGRGLLGVGARKVPQVLEVTMGPAIPRGQIRRKCESFCCSKLRVSSVD